ncbi:hypothetical protein C7B69_17665 [filamentous cyanobacterium Phorm 46]|nr:hypothetical protein C7B69_17665 [filamentous cyanobacterium Phorm 46]PSB50502.1 hypothetical protein C7B67_14335 [filamentous cyanobacterium Phorm 6]
MRDSLAKGIHLKCGFHTIIKNPPIQISFANQSSTNLLEEVLGGDSPFLPVSIADREKCI